MKKRVNINRDVESRRNIAALKPAVQPIVKTAKSSKANETKEEKKEVAEVKAATESTDGATKRVTKKV